MHYRNRIYKIFLTKCLPSQENCRIYSIKEIVETVVEKKDANGVCSRDKCE